MSLSNIAAIPKNVNPAANIISTIINSIKIVEKGKLPVTKNVQI